MFLFFHFLHSNVPGSKCHKQKGHKLFFTRIRLAAHVPACVQAIARIKWIRLSVQQLALAKLSACVLFQSKVQLKESNKEVITFAMLDT